jgi:hypothetical protein
VTITQLDHVPLVDLRAQHEEVADDVRAAFDAVFDATAFVGGPDVAAFEAEFARYCAARHCIGAANGTDAIEMVLRGLGVGTGDEVIVPTNTFIATAEAVVRAGATVVLVDCDSRFHLIDPARIVGERVEDTECRGSQFQREPDRRREPEDRGTNQRAEDQITLGDHTADYHARRMANALGKVLLFCFLVRPNADVVAW